MKCRKKPVVVDYFPVSDVLYKSNHPEWITEALDGGVLLLSLGCVGIATLEGVMTGLMGDFIIKGVKGELYPCRGDIFACTYEPVED